VEQLHLPTQSILFELLNGLGAGATPQIGDQPLIDLLSISRNDASISVIARSDIYESFCAAHEIGTHFLIRTRVDRLAGDGDHTSSASSLDKLQSRVTMPMKLKDVLFFSWQDAGPNPYMRQA